MRANPIVIVPAAGGSRRFADAGISTPKALLTMRVNGGEALPMLGHILETIPEGADIRVGTTTENKFRFQEKLGVFEEQATDVEVIDCGVRTNGQADTVLRCLRIADADRPVVVLNCDGRSDYPLETFIDQCHEFPYGAMVMDGHGDTSFSYVGGFPLFCNAHEKKPVSRWALVGVYYFLKARELMDALTKQTNSANGKHTNGEYYLSRTFYHMPGSGLAVAVPRESFRVWGTPWELARDPNVTVCDPNTEELLKEYR